MTELSARLRRNLERNDAAFAVSRQDLAAIALELECYEEALQLACAWASIDVEARETLMAIVIGALMRGELDHPQLANARDLARRRKELDSGKRQVKAVKPNPHPTFANYGKAGTVDENGNVISNEPGKSLSSGEVWVINDKEACKAERHGWKRLRATQAGLVCLAR